jgi:predicted nuclease of predicted toxin-antitoxin system
MSGAKFLADESCDFGVVRVLRGGGFDVVAVSERTSRSIDEEVMAQAVTEGRILLTEDKDFGWLAFVKGVKAGVILIRWPSTARQGLLDSIVDLVKHQPQHIARVFYRRRNWTNSDGAFAPLIRHVRRQSE